MFARLFATSVFKDVIKTQENLKTAKINGFCKKKKPSLVIANDLKNKKKQNQNGGFLSISFEALTLFDDVKRVSVQNTSSHSITASKVIVIFT